MIDCAECGSPDGALHRVPGGHDVLCWRCYTRRLGADQDIPRPTTPEEAREVTGRLRQDDEERHGTSAADQRNDARQRLRLQCTLRACNV